MYDGGTAIAEVGRDEPPYLTQERNPGSPQRTSHLPHRLGATYAGDFDFTVKRLPLKGSHTCGAINKLISKNTACVIIQNPNFGSLEDV